MVDVHFVLSSKCPLLAFLRVNGLVSVALLAK